MSIGVVERIESISNIYEGVEEYIDLWIIGISRISGRFLLGNQFIYIYIYIYIYIN